MINKKITFDTIIRLTGSLSLVLAVLFLVPGFQNRTIGNIFLWLSLLVGVVGLIGSFLGRRAWYSLVIIVAVYLLVISHYIFSQIVQFVVMLVVLMVGIGGLANNFVTKNYSKRLFMHKKP